MGRGPHRARGTTGSGLGTFNRQIKLRRPVPAVTCRSRVEFLRRVAWPERMGMCRATRGDRRDSPCVLELSFQNLAENAHGLVLEICPLFFLLLPYFIICQAFRGTAQALTYRVVGSVTWDPGYTRSSKISRNMVTISDIPISVY